MLDNFKIWFENKAINDQMRKSEEAKKIYFWLMKKREINEMMGEIDKANFIVKKMPNIKAIMPADGQRIPVEILKVTSEELLLKRTDGKDFMSIAHLWPIFPDKNDRTIIELPNRFDLVKNNNATLFVKSLSLILSRYSDPEEEYSNLLAFVKRYFAEIKTNMKRFIKAAEDENINLIDLYGSGEGEPVNFEKIGGFDESKIIEVFNDGMMWIADYLSAGKISYILIDSQHREKMRIFVHDKNITYENNNRIYSDTNYLPYLKGLLKNSEVIKKCEYSQIFPDLFSNKDIKEIMLANQYLQPSDSIEKLVLDFASGKNLEKAQEEFGNIVPLLKDIKIIDGDLKNDLLMFSKEQFYIDNIENFFIRNKNKVNNFGGLINKLFEIEIKKNSSLRKLLTTAWNKNDSMSFKMREKYVDPSSEYLDMHRLIYFLHDYYKDLYKSLYDEASYYNKQIWYRAMQEGVKIRYKNVTGVYIIARTPKGKFESTYPIFADFGFSSESIKWISENNESTKEKIQNDILESLNPTKLRDFVDSLKTDFSLINAIDITEYMERPYLKLLYKKLESYFWQIFNSTSE